MAEQGQSGLRFSVGPTAGPSPYCNNVRITSSFFDFYIEFLQNVPVLVGQTGGPPENSPNLVQRIVMSPEHAKALLELLGESVANYEGQFGEIKPKPHSPPPPQANDMESS
jgi:hypothetical protein